MIFSKFKHTVIKKRFNKKASKLKDSRIVSEKEIQTVGVLTTQEHATIV